MLPLQKKKKKIYHYHLPHQNTALISHGFTREFEQNFKEQKNPFLFKLVLIGGGGTSKLFYFYEMNVTKRIHAR